MENVAGHRKRASDPGPTAIPSRLRPRIVAGLALVGAIALWRGWPPVLAVVVIFALTVAAWAAAGRLVRRSIDAGAREITESYLIIGIDVVAFTTALMLLGALEGPAIGIYGLMVVTAGIVAGTACAVTIGVFSLLCYAAGLAIEESGGIPEFLVLARLDDAGGSTLVRQLLFAGAIVAAGLLASSAWADKVRSLARRAEGRYRALFHAASDPIALWDSADDRIIDANPAAERISGLSRSQLLAPDGLRQIRAALQRVEDAGGTDGATLFRYVRPDGEGRMVSLAARPFVWEERPVGVAVVHDLTDQRRLAEERTRNLQRLEVEIARRTSELVRTNRELVEVQSRLLRAQRLGATEDVAGSIAHAINNPLAALIGTAELMKESCPGDDPRLDRILRIAARIRSVVAGTLDLFRRGSLELQSVPPLALIEAVHREIGDRARSQGVEVDIKVESGLPEVLVDPTLVGEALVAIAENAIEAMPAGGHLWLEAEAVAAAEAVRLRVSDTGPGIARSLREKIFYPYFTTKRAGTGLGLAIANGVIHGHRGVIRVEDRPGGGASIVVEIPAHIGSERVPVWGLAPLSG